MNVKITLGVLFILLIGLSSCEKRQFESAKEITNEELSVINGMLSFKSHESFLAQMAEWEKIDLKTLDKIINKYSFQSYALDTLTERENNVTPDPVLRRVLNEKAAIQVGDSIFVINKDSEIIIKGSSLETYKNVINGMIKGDDIEVVAVQKYLNESSFDIMSSSPTDVTPFYKTPNTWYGETAIFTPEEDHGRPERIKLVVFATTSILYPNAGATLKGEAYRRGGVFGKRSWHEDEMAEVTFTLTSMLMNDGQSVVNQTPVTVYNMHEIKLIYGSSGTNPAGAYVGFVGLNFTLQMRKNGNTSVSPMRTMTYRIINGIEQPLIKSW